MKFPFEEDALPDMFNVMSDAAALTTLSDSAKSARYAQQLANKQALNAYRIARYQGRMTLLGLAISTILVVTSIASAAILAYNTFGKAISACHCK